MHKDMRDNYWSANTVRRLATGMHQVILRRADTVRRANTERELAPWFRGYKPQP